MDDFKNSSLLDYYRLGKLFLAFEKIYNLKQANYVLRKNAIKNGDKNLGIYINNCSQLNLITMELLQRGKAFYDKLTNKDKMQLKPYLNKFKMSAQQEVYFSTVNGLPYCTCDQETKSHTSLLENLNELYNQLKTANQNIKVVQSINKNLRQQLDTLTKEFSELKQKVSNVSSSEDSWSSEEFDEKGNFDCKTSEKEIEKARAFLNEVQETISKCMDLTSSENEFCKNSLTYIDKKKENNSSKREMINIEVVEIINVKQSKSKNNGAENTADDNECVTKEKEELKNNCNPDCVINKDNKNNRNVENAIDENEGVTEKKNSEETENKERKYQKNCKEECVVNKNGKNNYKKINKDINNNKNKETVKKSKKSCISECNGKNFEEENTDETSNAKNTKNNEYVDQDINDNEGKLKTTVVVDDKDNNTNENTSVRDIEEDNEDICKGFSCVKKYFEPDIQITFKTYKYD